MALALGGPITGGSKRHSGPSGHESNREYSEIAGYVINFVYAVQF